MSWRVQRVGAPAAELHTRPLVSERTVTWCEVDAPALVLGSAQRVEVNAPRFDVVRRRSGGGAVLVVPGQVVWADVTIPAADPLWETDVGRAFWWLGDVWAAALRSLGLDAVVHRGPLVKSRWSQQVCFAGLGSGEVTVSGRKVVGISQRRTRAAALFQCACLLRWDPAPLAAALGLPSGAAEELAPLAAGATATASAIEAAFQTVLMRSDRAIGGQIS